MQFKNCNTYPISSVLVLKFCKECSLLNNITEISCGIPLDGINTQTIPQVNLLHQDTYNYSCLAGYETNDNITTECQADGSWSVESSPNCTSKLQDSLIFNLTL